MVTENEAIDTRGNRVRYKKEPKKSLEKHRTAFADNFYKEIQRIDGLAHGVSKVNEIRSGDVTIIVFQIENSLDGKVEKYITVDDSILLVNSYLQKMGLPSSLNSNKHIRTAVNIKKMKSVDKSFENKELEVISLKSFNENFIDDFIESCIINGSKENIELNEKNEKKNFTINFKNSSTIDTNEKEELLNENEMAMFSDVHMSEEIKNNMKDEIKSNDFLDKGLKFFQLPTNTNYEVDKNDFESIESLKKNQNEKSMSVLYKDLNGDWTNQVVNRIIGNMYEEGDKSIGNISQTTQEKTSKNEIEYNENFTHENQFLNDDFSMQPINQNIPRTGISGQNSRIRPFICHFRSCNRAFKRFEHLKRHYRIHTGERPFKCKFPGCHKAFARSDNLNQHLRVHNNGSPNIDEVRRYRFLDEEN